MDILMVSTSKIIQMSNIWKCTDFFKFLILLICFIICVITLLSFMNTSSKNIKNYTSAIFCVSAIVLVISGIIDCIPMHNNVNSSEYFNEPYIFHSHNNNEVTNYQISSYTYVYAPITVANHFRHDKFKYNQHKELMRRYSNDLARIKHTNDVPKSLILKYKHNVSYNRLVYLKLNLKLQKYRAYLDKLPAKDVQKPSWWMYL